MIKVVIKRKINITVKFRNAQKLRGVKLSEEDERSDAKSYSIAVGVGNVEQFSKSSYGSKQWYMSNRARKKLQEKREIKPSLKHLPIKVCRGSEKSL